MDPTTTPTPTEAPTTTAVREARPTLPPLEDPEVPARNKFHAVMSANDLCIMKP